VAAQAADGNIPQRLLQRLDDLGVVLEQRYLDSIDWLEQLAPVLFSFEKCGRAEGAVRRRPLRRCMPPEPSERQMMERMVTGMHTAKVAACC